MILLYIIIIALGLVALYFAGMFVLVIVAFALQSYQLATGKITREQLDAKIKAAKEQRSHKKGSTLHYLSYPSPLNNWGLWN